MKQERFGIIGLGRMGGNLAIQAREKGYHVIGYDNSPVREELIKEAIEDAEMVQNFRELLKAPRIIFLYVPTGKVVDIVIEELAQVLDKGDVIVDGGNSYWGDSIRRAEKLKRERDIYFIDCGTSGGIEGARKGACFMIGGEKYAADMVTPILKELAVPNGVVYAGPSGAGHFAKLVHNGIEFGMLQSIGEGVALLEKFKDKLNIGEIINCWNNGSVIRSWLIELMGKMYNQKDGLASIPSYVEDTGEVNWLLADALKMEVPVPVITQSLMQLFASRDKDTHAFKSIAMMRNGFGGHPFGESEAVKTERQLGRVGEFPHDGTSNGFTSLVSKILEKHY